jgi:Flp pilus assembly protein TadD
LSLNALGVVYAKGGDMKGAINAWNRAVGLDPRQYDALYNIAIAELDAGNREEARSALERFVATAPKDRYGPDIAAARKTLQRMGQ